MKDLTDHERRILRLVSLGHTHEEIAAELTMTAKGVTPTVNRAIRKLGARNAPHAIHLAYQTGLFRRERHGDHAGYAAHLYRGEKACDACKAGEREYRNARRNQQQEDAA